MTARERFEKLREDHLARRCGVERDAREAAWKLSLTGHPDWERESGRLETELKRILADRRTYEELLGIRDSGEIEDPQTRRELDVLILEHAGNQVDEALLEEIVSLEVRAESVYAGFRPELDGRRLTENDIRGILRDSDDPAERRRAWEASKEIGPRVAPLLLEMVEKRNRAATRLGYRDHYAMALALQEIDEGFLFATLERLEELTREPYDDLVTGLFDRLAQRFSIRREDVRPWHLADPFFQEAVPAPDLALERIYEGRDLVELTRRSFAAIGFDIEAVIERSDLFPREGKNQHAFCTHVDRATDDIRVLCNIVPGEYWMDTMLHEFGHAVYDQGLGSDLPWILRQAAHTLSTEAIALLFGRLATDPDWMLRFAGARPREIELMRAGLHELRRTKQLLFPRWVMVMVHFERALYGDPGCDLDGLWWDLVERFQKVARPEGRAAPDWACKIHFALAPVYYHSYLLGDLMASQLHAFLESELATPAWFDDPRTGALLAERLFRDGARRPWDEALRHATGRPLDPVPYIEQFVTVSS